MAQTTAETSRAYRQRHAEKVRARGRAWYQAHKEEQNKKRNAYRRAHPEKGAEYQREYRLYQREYRLLHPGASAALQRRSYANHREDRVLGAKKARAALKAKVLSHYGGECDCCGESRLEFLTVDHINGGGTKHRRTVSPGGTGFYQWIVREGYPADLRVLCFNCNCALGMFGYCPHKEGTRL